MYCPVITTILLLGSVAAQDSERQSEQERLLRAILPDLKSSDPPRIATAAVALGDSGVRQAVPELRKTLSALHEMDHRTGVYPTLAVLDALVRLQAKVPGKELDHLLKGRTLPAAMMLMARAPQDCEAQLVRVFDENSGNRTQFCWLAAGNLLAKLRSKPFAKLLLKRMKVVVEAKLIRPGDEVDGVVHVGLGGGASMTSSHYFSLRGYSPFGIYELDRSMKKGDATVAKGAVPIFGRRLRPTGDGRRIRVRSSWRHMDITARQLEWAATLLRTTVPKLPMRARARETLFYRDSVAYRRDIARLRDVARGSVSALRNRLRHAGLIGKDETVQLSVEVVIHVIDRRPSAGPELPEITGVKVIAVPLPRKKLPQATGSGPNYAEEGEHARSA